MNALGIAARISPLLTAYGALFLATGPGVGALVLGATLIDPGVGLLGLAAGVSALATRAVLRLPALAGEADVLNAIYAGLALGAFHAAGDGRLIALALLAGVLVIPLASALSPLLRQTRELPLLGAPFLGTVWTLLAAAKTLGIPWRGWPSALLFPDWIDPALSTGLATAGALFYVANPLSGALIVAAVWLASPTLGLVALAGGGLGWGLIIACGIGTGSALPLLAAFNGALTALILSTHTVPTLRSASVIGGSVIVATVFSVALLWLLWPLGLPPLSAPFLLTVWLARAALRPERSAFWARFWLPVPARPEHSLSGQRLEKARGLDRASIALRPPFVGRMDIAQAMNGLHTHRGPWRYALDFMRTEQGLSFRGEGCQLPDFYSFDQPVLAPVWGMVLVCRNDVADNPPGAINLRDNWGNYVMISLGNGHCVLLAHLRQGSVSVWPGQWIGPGTPIGRCGNSGRSTQPHLHLQVQRGDWLGAATSPFHLAGYQQDAGHFVLDGNPQQGETLENPPINPALAQALSLPAGREWRFAVGDSEWTLAVHIGLLGETALVSSRGGRMLACCTDLVFALYQRSGAADPVLDAFSLSFGLTPLLEKDCRWRDAPLVNWQAFTRWQRLRAGLRQPLGSNLDSRYQRQWDTDRGLWLQRGVHRLPAVGGDLVIESEGWLSESQGPVGFRLSVPGGREIRVGLCGFGNQGDYGVPAWSLATVSPAALSVLTP